MLTSLIVNQGGPTDAWAVLMFLGFCISVGGLLYAIFGQTR